MTNTIDSPKRLTARNRQRPTEKPTNEEVRTVASTIIERSKDIVSQISVTIDGVDCNLSHIRDHLGKDQNVHWIASRLIEMRRLNPNEPPHDSVARVLRETVERLPYRRNSWWVPKDHSSQDPAGVPW